MFMTILNLAAWVFVIAVAGIVALLAVMYTLRAILELIGNSSSGGVAFFRWVRNPESFRELWRRDAWSMVILPGIGLCVLVLLAFAISIAG